MKFKPYLDEILKISPNAFAVKHEFPSATVWRAYNGKELTPRNADRFSKACNELVSREEFLFPKEVKEPGPEVASQA